MTVKRGPTKQRRTGPPKSQSGRQRPLNKKGQMIQSHHAYL